MERLPTSGGIHNPATQKSKKRMMLPDILFTLFLTHVGNLTTVKNNQRRFAPTPAHITGIKCPHHRNTHGSRGPQNPDREWTLKKHREDLRSDREAQGALSACGSLLPDGVSGRVEQLLLRAGRR